MSIEHKPVSPYGAHPLERRPRRSTTRARGTNSPMLHTGLPFLLPHSILSGVVPVAVDDFVAASRGLTQCTA
jgi:hypothetical protein